MTVRKNELSWIDNNALRFAQNSTWRRYGLEKSIEVTLSFDGSIKKF